MSTLPRNALLRRELSAGTRIPYTAHLSDTVVRTTYGDYVQVFRLAGASFESADDEQLNSWHERLNVTWRNLSTPQVALWSHLIRRRERLSEHTTNAGGFADTLEAKYRHRLAAETLMVNELYLATVYRPVTGVATSAISKLLSRTQHDADTLERRDALDACQKLASAVCASLARYEPEPLGLTVHQGRSFSAVLEFFGTLINGESQPVPLAPAPLSELLATSRLFFGLEALEYRLPTRTRAGAILGIKEYPTPTTVGFLDRLLSAPFSFVLSQSFTFLSKAAGQALLQRQYNRMLNAGDFAISQAEQLQEALDALTSNEFVMGDHHLSLQILTDPDDDPTAQGTQRRIKRLNDQVAIARALLADTGMTVAREDLALEAAFWAQLPGHFPMRPRKAPITSRNFAALVP